MYLERITEEILQNGLVYPTSTHKQHQNHNQEDGDKSLLQEFEQTLLQSPVTRKESIRAYKNINIWAGKSLSSAMWMMFENML